MIRARVEIWSAPCGCAALEEGNGVRLEFCGLGARIEAMRRAAMVGEATAPTHRGYLRWRGLYHQRADMMDAHTGQRHEIGVIEQA